MPPASDTASRHYEDSALARLIRRGPYFTDDVRLFRLTAVVSGSSGPKFVELEDCRTLDTSEYTEEEVVLFDLVPVDARPAGEDADGGESAAPGHREHGRRARAHQA